MKGLAFDAVTAWRVFSLIRYVRDEPESPAAEAPAEDEREVSGIVVGGERLLQVGERRLGLTSQQAIWRATFTSVTDLIRPVHESTNVHNGPRSP